MEHKRKKLMMLGGLRSLLPVIQAAHEQGYYVITCDYIPGNMAHEYSDEYHNVSIIDKEAVLNKARELQIDGIMSFGVDPGVVSAAYVQKEMGLPGNPYDSVAILQNKSMFRQFLKEHGFAVPWFKGFGSVEEALAGKGDFPWPVIVKPTDSAGSKGVSRVDNPEQLETAARHAIAHSFSKKIVIEEFIDPVGHPSDSDCFSVDGVMKFVSFSDQRFDDQASNPYVPSAYSWPSTMAAERQAELSSELQRLISLLGMRTSIYNVETRVGSNGKAYIMEVSPRGGGPRLAEMVRYASGVDMITNAVRAAVGDELIGMEQQPYAGHWGEIILHAKEKGAFGGLQIAPAMAQHVIETDLWVKEGDPVNAFDGANDAIGILIVRVDGPGLLEEYLSHQDKWLKIIVKQPAL